MCVDSGFRPFKFLVHRVPTQPWHFLHPQKKYLKEGSRWYAYESDPSTQKYIEDLPGRSGAAKYLLRLDRR